MRGRRVLAVACFALAALLAPGSTSPPAPEAASAGTLPSGFVETTVFNGLTQPTAVRFATDGRVFVAEKSGLIKVFDNVNDTTPTVFADLRTNVDNFWDRGLLGLALHPQFPTVPYVYVLYTYDHELGSASPPPRWGDACPTPPGPTTDGCVVSGRLSRLQASGDVMTGSEQVLIEDWCQQFPSHSVGTVAFGPDGALYASGGDGAGFNYADYGQAGSPLNPCGDPPGGVGATLTPPTAEGGALRSQDVLTMSDPVTLDGSIIRVDPDTGAGLPSNPMGSSPDPNARRIIAHGLRNPFRFAFRPGTNEIWLGDVGWSDYEEINRIPDATDSVMENFGWPCYEGTPRQPGYDSLGLTMCANLSQAQVTNPYFAYKHSDDVVPGEGCTKANGSSVSGISFEFAPNGSTYPAAYQGALFFADYTRNCIWVMKKGGNPIPNPGQIETFDAGAASPVDLKFGPDGNLYYVDFNGGRVQRIAPGTVQPPSSAYLSDLIWSSMVNGYGPVEKDMSNGEDLQGDGRTITLNGVTYAKGLGAHAASDVRYALDGGCSRFTASVGVDDEVGTFGTVVFQVFSDGTKIYDSGLMTGASATKSIDVSITGTNELRLVVTDGGDGSAYDHADWALARVECGSGGDTTPPTVTAQTPAPGATGVPTTATPTVSFSEPMTASTVNGTTFTLTKQGAGSPVSATVTYNSNNQTATLTPAQALDPASTYNAVVLGGANGVKDLAGLSMQANSTWSFTTQSGPNNPPVPTIDTPPATLTWKVGDSISFSGHAADTEDGALPASALSWELILEHCPSACHEHVVQTWDGVASGSFSAPDHEYPSFLRLRLTAKDSAGTSATTAVDLQPITVNLTFATSPSGLQIGVNDSAGATPFTRTVIVGSANSLSALATQTLGSTNYDFVSWSDGGARVHNITAPATPTTYTATYVAQAGPPVNTSLPVITGTPTVGQTLSASTGTWTGAQPITYIYRWLRCRTPSINSCALISGAQAQASTYIVVSADQNRYLRAGIRATNASGSSEAVSNPTAKVR